MNKDQKQYKWFACPCVHPEKGFVCGKPASHSGKCVAHFSHANSVTWLWDQDSSEFMDEKLCSITVTEDECMEFGIWAMVMRYNKESIK